MSTLSVLLIEPEVFDQILSVTIFLDQKEYLLQSHSTLCDCKVTPALNCNLHCVDVSLICSYFVSALLNLYSTWQNCRYIGLFRMSIFGFWGFQVSATDFLYHYGTEFGVWEYLCIDSNCRVSFLMWHWWLTYVTGNRDVFV